ncbi:MAG: ASCH domain-containing protein [Bacteroidaceae bacterium]|nr:ASCH domain-containing protein [Bacteroidaceae bacterium]
MKVLLSIKPEFVEKIFNGTKKYEFRKSIFKNKDVDTVVVYASSPCKCIIGEFKIEAILCDNVDKIWKQTQGFSGISEKFYRIYFAHKTSAYAIKIGRVTKFKKPKQLSDYHINHAPQSFVYLRT